MITTITKYAQSCFLLEKSGKRLLLDPGNYVYENDGMTPENWLFVHVVLLTHTHQDHAFRPGIKRLVEKYQCPIFTNASLAPELNVEGIPANVLKPGEEIEVGSFMIRGVEQYHGRIPPVMTPGPEDIGFVIDNTFYHTGDSIPMLTMPHADVLFVPVSGPQMNFDTARTMIATVKPKLAIPMHYANIKKYPISMDEVRAFHVPGVELLVLDDGVSFTWPKRSLC